MDAYPEDKYEVSRVRVRATVVTVLYHLYLFHCIIPLIQYYTTYISNYITYSVIFWRWQYDQYFILASAVLATLTPTASPLAIP